ncbi:uncharacterized protein Z520_03534 [Fonsecaea multimorphosa CBS 102226]|uniref:Uncharacterized protein n=1 Tax=Fonsecaea multimorphosa CBS 102226 TaxID=1442371 RepID=A0A0D2K4Z4_9EURO|nr:uncharacterized protein Z520_03534 [Fonsecaea multimorphosa CBS 102226]KIY00868.1 hypothetical protein Z520_03534 [Fonsecaea multimorphosa CBS 102226]
MGSAGGTIGIVTLIIILVAVAVSVVTCLRRKHETPPNIVYGRQHNGRWSSEYYSTRLPARRNLVNGKTARERGEVDPWELRRDVRMPSVKPARVRKERGEAYRAERSDNWV